MESEGIHKVVKELLGAEREAAAAITNNSDSNSRDLDMTKMMENDKSEESC